jgi:DNA-binding LacI/PurR family transcriptional regulator
MTQPSRTKITSIADIARIAGVSVSTVSRALTGKGTLNPDTRERVRKIAQAHGFRLNVAAQNLRLGRTGAIAVMLPLGHEKGQHLSDPFFMAVLGFLADNISERGYELILSRVIPGDTDWLRSVTQSGRVDGVIVIGQSDQSAILDAVAAEYAPLLVWGAWNPGQTHLTVGTDNVAGGRLAAKHFLAKGRKRLAFFGNPNVPEFGARYKGFLSALPPDVRAAHVLAPVHITADASYLAAGDFLAANPCPDGVFAASDIVAMSVIRAAVEHGLIVPDDVAVIGFDDIPPAAHSIPPLTTIRQDLERGAGLLCDLLFRRMAGEACEPVQLPPELVVRGSA